MTFSFLLPLVEIASNRLLMLDDRLVRRCAALEGQCVAIEITDLQLILYCHLGSYGIRLSQQAPAKPVGATISGRLFALVDLMLNEDKISASIRNRVHISGDAGLATQLQRIVADLEFDGEEVLSGYTGDLLAFQIHDKMRTIGTWLQRNVRALMQTSSEYLREEARLTPTQVEFQHFQRQIMTMKHDLGRTEARVQRLDKKMVDAGLL